MAWIRTIAPNDAEGPLEEEYARALKRAGRVFKVIEISSLNPETLERWVGVYEAVMHFPSPLSRVEREMVATVVSQINDCYY